MPFWEPIVETGPLVTRPFGVPFHYFGVRFWEPIVENTPLVTRPFEDLWAKASRKAVGEARYSRLTDTGIRLKTVGEERPFAKSLEIGLPVWDAILGATC